MKTCTEFSPFLSAYGFEAAIKRIKALGYDAIDYGEFCHTENKIFHVSEEEFAATLKRERKIKSLTREEKQKLIESEDNQEKTR